MFAFNCQVSIKSKPTANEDITILDKSLSEMPMTHEKFVKKPKLYGKMRESVALEVLASSALNVSNKNILHNFNVGYKGIYLLYCFFSWFKTGQFINTLKYTDF